MSLAEILENAGFYPRKVEEGDMVLVRKGYDHVEFSPDMVALFALPGFFLEVLVEAKNQPGIFCPDWAAEARAGDMVARYNTVDEVWVDVPSTHNARKEQNHESNS